MLHAAQPYVLSTCASHLNHLVRRVFESLKTSSSDTKLLQGLDWDLVMGQLNLRFLWEPMVRSVSVMKHRAQERDTSTYHN